eukprot:142013_1
MSHYIAMGPAQINEEQNIRINDLYSIHDFQTRANKLADFARVSKQVILDTFVISNDNDSSKCYNSGMIMFFWIIWIGFTYPGISGTPGTLLNHYSKLETF